MLQRLPARMMAHEQAMELADRRALEKNAQHPQRMGAGMMGKKRMGLEDTRIPMEGEEEEHDENLKGKGMSPESRLTRLVGRGKRKSKAKQLEEIGKKELEAHKLEHEAMGEAHLQGGMLARHLREKYGEEHAKQFGKGFWDDFASGFKKGFSGVMNVAKPILSVIPHPGAQAGATALGALGFGKRRGRKMKGGAVDMITGAVNTGRVANPPPSFGANTVGSGYAPRHRVPEATGGKYYDEMKGGATTGSFIGDMKQIGNSFKDFKNALVKVGDTYGKKKEGAGFRKIGEGKTGGAKTGGASDARKRRGAMVSRLMKEKGMSLGEASRYIKENGLA